MRENGFDEHPLDSLLDEESDAEFGVPEIRDNLYHHADSNNDGKLRTWTAEDFSSIYVRFRPHLVRHAKRYLRDSSHAEEVVQDAFLYLMTSLPELDSELGVLKFLKWKIRLLCLDVMRKQSNMSVRQSDFGYLEELPDTRAESAEMGSELERLEDVAVINLALAKLNPRHREALLKSVYLEQGMNELSEDMGLSENATRQLLFRARRAFKNALIGEAETAGKSASEILSIAVKKGSRAMSDNLGKVSAFIAISVLSVSAISVGLQNQDSSMTLAGEADSFLGEDAQSSASGSLDTDVTQSAAEDTQEQVEPNAGTTLDSSVETSPPDPAEAVVTISNPEESTESTGPASGNKKIDEESYLSAAPASNGFAEFQPVLSTNQPNAGLYFDSAEPMFGELFVGESIEILGGKGLSAFIDYERSSARVNQLFVHLWVEGRRYVAIPAIIDQYETELDGQKRLVVDASNFLLMNSEQSVLRESPLDDSRVIVALSIDENNAPTSASLKVR